MNIFSFFANIVNIVQILHKYCEILKRYFTDTVQILYDYCSNIVQISSKYCTTTEQILYNYCANIVQNVV